MGKYQKPKIHVIRVPEEEERCEKEKVLKEWIFFKFDEKKQTNNKLKKQQQQHKLKNISEPKGR